MPFNTPVGFEQKSNGRLKNSKFLLVYPGDHHDNLKNLHDHICECCGSELKPKVLVAVEHDNEADEAYTVCVVETVRKAYESKSANTFDFNEVHPEVFVTPKKIHFEDFRKSLAEAAQVYPPEDRPTSKSEEDALNEEVYDWIVNHTDGKKRMLTSKNGPYYHYIRKNYAWARTTMEMHARKKISFPKFKAEEFNRPLLDFSKDTGFATHILQGGAGFGKTQYAAAHFPLGFLHANLQDKLKDFNADYHTGLVLDEFDFSKMSGKDIIAFLDADSEMEVRCRYNDAEIPSGTRKIILSNDPPFPAEKIQAGALEAIKSRVNVVLVSKPLFSGDARVINSRRVGMKYKYHEENPSVQGGAAPDQDADDQMYIDDIVHGLFYVWPEDNENDEGGIPAFENLQNKLRIGTGPLCCKYRDALAAALQQGQSPPTLDQQLRQQNGEEPMISFELLIELSPGKEVMRNERVVNHQEAAEGGAATTGSSSAASGY
jgi:hypothetical protein